MDSQPGSPASTSATLISSQPSSRDDQDGFIALGCIALFHSTANAASLDWTTVTCESQLSDLHTELDCIRRLLSAGWIRLLRLNGSDFVCLRLSMLADDYGLASLDRSSRSLRNDLVHVLSRLDISEEAWHGRPSLETARRFDLWATGINGSLFYLFNSLPSPSVSLDAIADRQSREVVEEVLDMSLPEKDAMIPGLAATLYPYQARTVAAMIERESASHTMLDPRYEIRVGPLGDEYFYSARDLFIKRSAPSYEQSKGGVLAETMGVGKTVMIIALVLATRYHLPRVPPEFVAAPMRQSVGRLSEMAISSALNNSISLKAELSWMCKESNLASLAAQVDAACATYKVPWIMRRSVRKNSIIPPPRTYRTCSTTIVVVPRNLLRQWQAEFSKHVDLQSSGLKILVLEKPKDRLPRAEVVAQYDILLFSKTRFEQEAKDGMDDKGRSTTNVRAGCACPYIGATRTRDCSCLRPEDIYQSPLKELHFLRIVIDEGHEFSSSSSNAVRVATSLVKADRRWIVSGTPAKERLFGADVELAAHTNATERAKCGHKSHQLQAIVDDRKDYSRAEEMNGASRSLGMLLSNFLQVRPWASTEGEFKSDWDDFAFRHESLRGKTHTAFSRCMASTLNALVLKTRPEDVERDVLLPPLHVSVKYLEPCFYDKATLNLFNFFITANAVTSERTDQDYLFHKNSLAARRSLIRNLRASAFFWTGFTESDLLSAIGHSERYLTKEGTAASQEDRLQLGHCVAFAQMLLGCGAWKAMSATHEIALFASDWPDEMIESWSLNKEKVSPILIGASHLMSAQSFLNDRLFDESPLDSFSSVGQYKISQSYQIEEHEAKKKKSAKSKDNAASKMGVPASGLREKQTDSRHNHSPRKASSRSTLDSQNALQDTEATSTIQHLLKRRRSVITDSRELDAQSPLAQTSVIGTVSSKLSYLLDRVVELHTEEKVLIFYDSDNAAYYISQALDVFHIKHLIYARHLNAEQRSKYIVTFDTDDSVRVLLMDVTHGAYGLNVNKASRVFFLNPPCSPHVEAQAIKRAHRIGQTRPVYVETLILQNTIEDAIFKRSKAMTREEHDHAGKEISDDKGVAEIIQQAKSIPLSEDEGKGSAQMAPLVTPLQVFGRKNRHDTKINDVDREENAGEPARKKKKRAKMVSFALPSDVSTAAAGAGSSAIRLDQSHASSIFG